MLKIIIALYQSLAVFFKFVHRGFAVLWKILGACRRIVFNLAFLLMLIFILSLFILSALEEDIPSDVALVMAPSGDIVIQKTYAEPMEALLDNSRGMAKQRETRLRDVIDALDYAREDKRIKLVVLDLKHLRGAGVSKLQKIGAALKRFKQSGKKIIAKGDHYFQNQYYLAAHADEIWLHPHGAIALSGYGIYRNYFKDALDKLMVQFHVFRVGSYKSALEPFFRNDMSPEAKEANLAWLQVLWNAYQTDVTTLRGLENDALDGYINHLNEHLRTVKGDAAQLALNYKLVDQLKTRHQMRDKLIEYVGRDKAKKTYKQIHFSNYLNLIRPEKEKNRSDAPKIGVIVAKGMILDGKQPSGKIGGETMVDLIRRARQNHRIKALTIHIDSGGGSAFASEIIRNEIALTRQTGKPVVVCMSSVAASGAYWLATAADEIWASETTITGSIGIFAALPTFEKSLQILGVSNDGVGTTQLADSYNPSRPLNPVLADSIEQMIENGYRRFLKIVAQGRDMEPEKVHQIAQGRVWDGRTAQKLGLVDHLGGLNEAVKSAASKAGISDYDIVYVKKPLSFSEQLVKQLSEKARIDLGDDMKPALLQVFLSLWKDAGDDIAQLVQFNDPQGLYARCLTCDIQ